VATCSPSHCSNPAEMPLSVCTMLTCKPFRSPDIPEMILGRKYVGESKEEKYLCILCWFFRQQNWLGGNRELAGIFERSRWVVLSLQKRRRALKRRCHDFSHSYHD